MTCPTCGYEDSEKDAEIERLQLALAQGRVHDQCILDEAIKAATKAKDAEIEQLRRELRWGNGQP